MELVTFWNHENIKWNINLCLTEKNKCREGLSEVHHMLLALMNVQKMYVSFCSPRGVEPYDNPTTVFVQRHEPQGDSSILSSTDFFQSEQNRRVILEKVDSFQLRDKYMFATTTRVRVHSEPQTFEG